MTVSLRTNWRLMGVAAVIMVICGFAAGSYIDSYALQSFGPMDHFWAHCIAGWILLIALLLLTSVDALFYHDFSAMLPSLILGGSGFVLGAYLGYSAMDLMIALALWVMVISLALVYWPLTAVTEKRRRGRFAYPRLTEWWVAVQAGSLFAGVAGILTGMLSIWLNLPVAMIILGALMIMLTLLVFGRIENPSSERSEHWLMAALGMAVPFAAVSGILTLQWPYALYGALYGFAGILIMESVLYVRSRA